MANVRARASPSRLTIVLRRTTAWTTAERAKPKMSAQRICQVIEALVVRAWPTAWSHLMAPRQSRRSKPSGADETPNGVGGLGELDGSLRAARLDGVDHAVSQMVVEQFERYRLQRLGDG